MSLKKTDKIRLGNWAMLLRQEQGTKFTEPVSVHQLLRNKNIIASFQPLAKGFEGMAIKIKGEGKTEKLFMLINTNSNYSRQRFTACHELYHLLYQNDFTVSVDTETEGQSKDTGEQYADYFARCLLLPKEGIVALLPENEHKKDSVTLATVLKLEQNFRCSRSCMLYRLKEMDFISETLYDAYQRDIVRSAVEYGYPTYLYKPTYSKELVGDYNVKARSLYDKGMVSEAKYFSWLRDMGIDLEKEVLDGKDEGNIG